MNQSESIKELAKALARAQAKIGPAKRSGLNPHFRSNFSTLEDAHSCSKSALAEEGLSIIQPLEIHETLGLCVCTQIMHVSGEWVRGVQPVMATRADPQAAGSAITYARRQSYMAIVGIAAEDDDGEAAMKPHREAAKAPVSRPSAAPSPKPTPAPELGSVPTEELYDVNKWVIDFGKFKGKRMGEVAMEDLLNYADWLESNAKKRNEMMGPAATRFCQMLMEFQMQHQTEEIPF